MGPGRSYSEAEVSEIDIDDDLMVERRGIATVLTLRAQERMNAMRSSSWARLRQALTEAESDPRTKAVVITGEGDRAFCAGGDILGYASLNDADERRAFLLDCFRTFEAIENSPLPVIAAVNGIAAGGGFELALAADFVVAARSARFSVPEAKLGLVPGFGVLRLIDHVGPKWSKYLIMSGEPLTATEAERLGIVQEVTEPGDALTAALRMVENLGRSAPMAVRAAKTLVNTQIDRRYYASIDTVLMLQGTSDAAEGINAFASNRPTSFRGH